MDALTTSANCGASTRLYWPHEPRSWWHASTAKAAHQTAAAGGGLEHVTNPSKRQFGASEHSVSLPERDALEAAR